MVRTERKSPKPERAMKGGQAKRGCTARRNRGGIAHARTHARTRTYTQIRGLTLVAVRCKLVEKNVLGAQAPKAHCVGRVGKDRVRVAVPRAAVEALALSTAVHADALRAEDTKPSEGGVG